MKHNPNDIVSTYCIKCGKPYCTCKEDIKIGSYYKSLGCGIAKVLREDGNYFIVEYENGMTEKIDKYGFASLRDNIHTQPQDLILNNSPRTIKINKNLYEIALDDAAKEQGIATFDVIKKEFPQWTSYTYARAFQLHAERFAEWIKERFKIVDNMYFDVSDVDDEYQYDTNQLYKIYNETYGGKS